jgi:hypothetical protein
MKRSVVDKNLGPLVKTVMTRCIQCTRWCFLMLLCKFLPPQISWWLSSLSVFSPLHMLRFFSIIRLSRAYC